MKKLVSILVAPFVVTSLYANGIQEPAKQDIVAQAQTAETSLENLIQRQEFFVIDKNTFESIYPTYQKDIKLQTYEMGPGFVSDGKLYIVSDNIPTIFKNEKKATKKGEDAEKQEGINMEENIWDSVYILRNTARYENKIKINGKERRVRVDGVSFGTAMAYEQKDGKTYLVTNEHVVSNDDSINTLFGGTFTKIRDKIEIIDSKETSGDNFKNDDLQTTVEVKSKKKDIGIVSTKNLLPYYKGKIGDSSKVKNGDKALVVGFPLAIAKTRASGEITKTDYHDEYEPFEWDYEGFLLSAPISPGSSGSPVFKIERTNEKVEYSWIGQIHAVFSRGQLMNIGIDINEYKDLLENKKAEQKETPPKTSTKYTISDEDYQKIKNYLDKATPSEHNFLFGDRKTEILMHKKERDIEVIIYQTGGNSQDLSQSLALIDTDKNGYGTLDSCFINDGLTSISIPLGIAPKSKLEASLNELYKEAFSWFKQVIEYRELSKRKQLSKEDYQKAVEKEKKIKSTASYNDQAFLLLDVLYTIEDMQVATEKTK